MKVLCKFLYEFSLSFFDTSFIFIKYRGTAVYRGVPLKKVLKIACGGVLPECKHLEFIGADTYFKYVRNTLRLLIFTQ